LRQEEKTGCRGVKAKQERKERDIEDKDKEERERERGRKKTWGCALVASTGATSV
jgi:hypothetical protein